MKKLLPIGLALAGALLPSLAFAAYNDVTLGSSAKITAAGETLDVIGDSNVIETIGVEPDFFTFTLKADSVLEVSSPGFNQIEWSATSTKYVVSSSCESTNSRVKFQSTANEVAITVFPKSTSCPQGSISSGGSGAGNSGGGGAAAVAAVAVVAPAGTAATIANLQAQLQSLLAQLAALQGGAAGASVSAMVSSGTITSNLSPGSQGASVKALQQFLNANGFTVAASGPGSPGNETELYGSLTTKAVQKFQEQYNIAKPGDPGYGYTGPKTRAKISELSGN